MDNVKSFIKPSFRLRLRGVTAPRLICRFQVIQQVCPISGKHSMDAGTSGMRIKAYRQCGSVME